MEKTKIKAPKQQIGAKIMQKSNKEIYTVIEVQRDENGKAIKTILADKNGKKKPVSQNTIDCKYSLYNDANIENKEIKETSTLINNIVEKSEDVSNTIDDTNKDMPVDIDKIYEDVINNIAKKDNTNKEIKDVSNTINDTYEKDEDTPNAIDNIVEESENTSTNTAETNIINKEIEDVPNNIDNTDKETEDTSTTINNTDEETSALIDKLLEENKKLKTRILELEEQLNNLKNISHRGGRPKKEYDENLAEQIIHLYRQGESYRNLAKRFGLSHSTIARTIKDNIDKY